VRRPSVPVPTVSRVKRRQVHLRHSVDHKPRKVPLGQPLTQTRRRQQLLLTITRKEVLGHDRIVLTDPDDTTRLCNNVPGRPRPPLWSETRRRDAAAAAIYRPATMESASTTTPMVPGHAGLARLWWQKIILFG
jgi:hypothetical protein